MKLIVIIVNWNSGQCLFECVKSLLSSSFMDFECYIVDNHSSDQSVDLVRLSISDKRLKFIFNNNNSGFGKACNQVLSSATGDYVLFLNPDTVIRVNTIELVINTISTRSDIQVIGVKNVNSENIIVPTCSRFPGTVRLLNDILGLSKLAPKVFKPGMIMTDWDHSDSKYVDHVIGAFYFVDFKFLVKVGFFDERFFLYLEDLDLSKRIVKAGGRIFYNAEIDIFHEGGGSSKNIKGERLFYSLQSRILFCEKYNKELNISIILLFSALIEPLVRISTSLLTLNIQAVLNTCKGYSLFYKWLFSRKPLRKLDLNNSISANR